MIQYTLNVIAKICSEIQIIDSKKVDIFAKSIEIIKLLKGYLEELKTTVSEYKFKNDAEEIQFFKETKPQIFCKLIYYTSIYKFEMSRPTGSDTVQKEFAIKQLDMLKEFFDINIDFYRYYRARRTDLDEHFFMRGKPEIELCFESTYIERDPRFSTGFDCKVARILANDLLSIYYNEELTRIEQPKVTQYDNVNHPISKLKWTGSKVSLIELIYALQTSGCINNGKSDLKRLTSFVEELFEIDLGDIYRAFLEIRGRKGCRVQYLDELRKKLIARMDDADNA